ncbi:MAG: hypothetical protein L6R41_007521 [Letrouitia leprolyta]|nr:MAG: hypothetical protein L6R41_007521 [Letrouitia leprolyta]
MLCLYFVLLTAYVSASPLSTPVDAHPWGDIHRLDWGPPDSDVASSSQCFATEQFHGIRLKPIHYTDCIEAAERVTWGGKAGAPMQFSRNSKIGMEVPEHWSYGNCVIRIDMKNPDDVDTFPLNDVANAASLIAQRCSRSGTPGLGGLAAIGPKQVVVIFVFGRVPPDPPKPRPSVHPAIAAF